MTDIILTIIPRPFGGFEPNCAIRGDSMTTEQLLITLASKLQEIADNTADVETESELNELIEKIYESVF